MNATTDQSTAVATTRISPALQVKRALDQIAPQLRDALPSHISPEKFQRVVMTVVNMQPELAKADKASLLSACMKCAADGLIPDGRDAALVLFKGKVQYMPMYAGLIRRARNSGQLAGISAHVIYERDHFAYVLGDEESIEHKPHWGPDRGKMIGVYAIARMKDGSVQREVLSAADVEKIRAVSRAGGSGPWSAWPDQMWRKTAIRRLAKFLPLDADVDRLLRRDDAITTGREPEPEAIAAAPDKLNALETELATDAEVVDYPEAEAEVASADKGWPAGEAAA